MQPRPQLKGSPTIATKTTNIKIMTKRNNAAINTRDAKLGPLKSRSRWLGRSLATAAKREEKEDNDRHEDHNKKGCE